VRPDEVLSSFPDRDPDSDHDSEDGNVAVPSRRRQRSGTRNHTRGGSIDLPEAPGVKWTPPASLFGSLVLRTFAAARPDRRQHDLRLSPAPASTRAHRLRRRSSNPKPESRVMKIGTHLSGVLTITTLSTGTCLYFIG
jgi:hypothetical protein